MANRERYNQGAYKFEPKITEKSTIGSIYFNVNADSDKKPEETYGDVHEPTTTELPSPPIISSAEPSTAVPSADILSEGTTMATLFKGSKKTEPTVVPRPQSSQESHTSEEFMSSAELAPAKHYIEQIIKNVQDLVCIEKVSERLEETCNKSIKSFERILAELASSPPSKKNLAFKIIIIGKYVYDLKRSFLHTLSHDKTELLLSALYDTHDKFASCYGYEVIKPKQHQVVDGTQHNIAISGADFSSGRQKVSLVLGWGLKEQGQNGKVITKADVNAK